MTRLADLDNETLKALAENLEKELELMRGNRLSLDLTRGKPDAEQLDLSNGLETAIGGDYIASDGTDTRNYGGLRGIPEARELGAEIMEVPSEQIICWGNSSLSLMYICVDLLMESGIWADDRRWSSADAPKLLTPVPGYDRHFVLSERLGLNMVNVGMNDDGPDMDAIRGLVSNDASIKGIWCVPKYSNPTGCTYSDEVVAQMADLPNVAAADDFVVLWDNAYAVHDFQFPRKPLANLLALADKAGTADNVLLFASTSKITHASAGLGFRCRQHSKPERHRVSTGCLQRRPGQGQPAAPRAFPRRSGRGAHGQSCSHRQAQVRRGGKSARRGVVGPGHRPLDHAGGRLLRFPRRAARTRPHCRRAGGRHRPGLDPGRCHVSVQRRSER